MTQTLSPATPYKRRVALFIDGENIPSDHAGRIIMQSLKHGQIAVRRVYGGVRKIPGWDAAPGFRLIHTGPGKNGADLMLAIEAVAMACEGLADVFVLVSSDRDFTPLAHHLRERAFLVIGMGEEKTPLAFRKACHEFCILGPVAADRDQPPAQDDIAAKVAWIIEGNGGPITIKLLGSRMGQSGIRISERPEKKWRTYLDTRPDLFRCEGEGQEACVRLVGRE